MKKIFLVSSGIVIGLVLLLLGYGFYLNYSNERNIALSFASQKVSLTAVKSKEGAVRTCWVDRPIKLHAQLQTDVVSRNSGILTDIFVEQGQLVEKGQVLAKVVSEEIDAKLVEIEAQLARARTLREKHGITYNRYNILKDTGAVSMEQVDTAKAEYFGANAEVKAMEAQKQQYELMLERLTLRAPFAGEVKMVYKKVGGYLSAGTPVMMVADFSKLLFYDDETTPSDLNELEPLGQELRLYFSESELKKVYSSKYSPGNDLDTLYSKQIFAEGSWNKFYKARVAKIEPPMEQPAESRTITYEVDNVDRGLEPRNYQSVILKSTVEQHGVLVPFSALDSNARGYTGNIIVVNGEGETEKRKVETGATDYSSQVAQIRKGLQAGEVVLLQYDEQAIGNKKVSFTVKEW